jgi:hypothetical protein
MKHATAGKYALFWADGVRGDSIAVLWLPMGAASSALSVAHSENTFPLALADPGSQGGGGGEVVPDTVGMLCGFKQLGGGLIKEIEVLSGARVISC